MTSFEVHGPFEITYEERKGGRTLVFNYFWNDKSPASYLAQKCGCYVFAISSGGGLKPIYIGKATKTFKQETFNQANRHKYHNGFSDYARGKPLMYFVVHPRHKGPRNETQIGEIEDFLKQAGAAKNPNLQNLRGRQRPNWSIKGVIRSDAGQPSNAAKDFRALFDINN